ncbi:MAG: DUF4214 domain-containing protein [Clostridiales bacterium]|nr:DUF4214 domain-containing protein [Clostridiales bacterium]
MKRKIMMLSGVAALLVSTIVVVTSFAKNVVAAEESDPTAAVAIDEMNFPDDIFRDYIKSNYDTNGDGSLSESEIEEVTKFGSIDLLQIADLSGIEFFSDLREFGFYHLDQLERLDLSKNTRLTNVHVSECPSLTYLNVTGCIELDELNCHDLPKLTNIDLSTNTELTRLILDRTGLVSLDVRKQHKLAFFSCNENKFTSLDVSNAEELQWFECDSNELVDIDLSKNPELMLLYCGNNRLTSLDVSSNLKLKGLYCFVNPLQYLDLSKNVELEILECSECELEKLDVNLNTKLKTLSCNRNNLACLDICNNAALEGLFCSNNSISELDVSKNSALKYLACDSNQLKSLDICNNKNLMRVQCYGNQIELLNTGNSSYLLTAMDEGREISREDEQNGIPYVGFDYGNVYYIYVDSTTEISRIVPTLTPTTAPTSSQEPTVTVTPTPTFTPGMNTPIPTITVTPEPTVEVTLTPKPTSPNIATPTPTPAPEKGSIGDFAERLYTVALNRESEASGKQYWVGEITNGNKTGADCALFFLTSEEFNNRKLSIEDFVETLYKTFFGRASEPNGKAYWVGELKTASKSREDVIRGFIDSAEWCNICADYGVKSGAPTAKAEHASQNAIDFATRLYTCCLGREPEAGGLKYWSMALTNLEQTGCSAAKLFFTSEEFVNFKLKDDAYVRRLYTTFMGRDPEASEIGYWTGEITKGTQTRYSVMQFFGQSPEFTNICKKYGIDRGTI